MAQQVEPEQGATGQGDTSLIGVLKQAVGGMRSEALLFVIAVLIILGLAGGGIPAAFVDLVYIVVVLGLLLYFALEVARLRKASGAGKGAATTNSARADHSSAASTAGDALSGRSGKAGNNSVVNTGTMGQAQTPDKKKARKG